MMAISYPPVRMVRPTKYLFIDGACLKATLADLSKGYAAGQPLDLDYAVFTAGYDKVFYYDALPSQTAEENETSYKNRLDAAVQFHDKLGALDRFHVYEGDTRQSPSKRRQEQKKVDIMIAVDMLTHSFRRNMQEATLLTSDLDFKPLLDALVLEGMSVTLWFPPNKTNKGLVSSADRRQQLDIQTIHHALRPRSKAMFTLPTSLAEPSRGDFAKVIHAWSTEDGDFKLFDNGGSFVLAGPNPNPGYSVYHSHNDLNLLKMYAGDVLHVVIPEK
jgi:uncharacterized LabA/DUF88 family protein